MDLYSEISRWAVNIVGFVAGLYYLTWAFKRIRDLLVKYHYRTWRIHQAFVRSIDDAAQLAIGDFGYFVSLMWLKASRCFILVVQFLSIISIYTFVFWIDTSYVDVYYFRLITYSILVFWIGMICFIVFLKAYSMYRIALTVATAKRDKLLGTP